MRGLLASLLLACLAGSPAFAVDWKALKPQGYVSDFAGVIDAPSRTALDQYAAAVEKATGAQMAFVVISTLQNEPIEDVANDLFHSWGIGQKGQDNGVMLLLVVQDHRSRLEVGHGLEEILPDGYDGLLLDNMRGELRAAQYGPAMLTAAQAIGEVIAKAKNTTIAAPSRPPGQRPVIQRHRDVPWLPILFGLFIFWTLLRSSTRGGGGGGGFWTGMLLGNLLNGVSYGGRGGGGFGGYDSGGSGGGFGGFGGGDSGGGGASSDW